MFCVPEWDKIRIHYLAVFLGYLIWHKKESKLELAASILWQIMPEFIEKRNVIILCDRYYSYDAVTAQYGSCFSGYMMLSLESREANDSRLLGELFLYFSDEIFDITWM